MLVRDPEQRLGSGELDAEEIKTHEFFKDMNWVELAHARLSPPWQPEVAGSLDVSHFDTDFTTLPLGKLVLTYPGFHFHVTKLCKWYVSISRCTRRLLLWVDGQGV